MRKHHILFISLLFMGLMILSASTVYQYMTGRKPLSVFAAVGHKDKLVEVTTERCNAKDPIAGLGKAQTPFLHKLAVYQQACHSFAADTMMIFVGMPVSEQTASQSAKQTAVVLKDFARYGVRPLVMAEPTDYANSTNINFAELAAGTYLPWLDAYFAQLKAAGLTDQQMGIWNPYPEANLPYWNNNLPQYFAPNVNQYVSSLRKYFPTAKTSIMLNSATYDTADFNWQSGEYDSLLPYVKGIPAHSIDYAGLEGFPWVPPRGGNGPILNAADFLNPTIISETADYLKTKNVWFNTGTFASKYALDPDKLSTIAPDQRKAVLATVDEQAQILQKQGYTVAINMFAQDKSKASEETDWSYWSGSNPFNSQATPVLTSFMAQLQEQHVDFWLFDQ